jgi:small subunit ribosomal protein S16
MLKIRLSRVGRKHEPVYRLILTDSRNPAKTGKSIEVLGSYDSRRGEKAIFDGEKITHWISKGAQISDTVHNILVKKGIIKSKKRNVLPKGVIENAKKKPEVAQEALPTNEVVETPTESAGAAEETVSEPVLEEVTQETV